MSFGLQLLPNMIAEHDLKRNFLHDKAKICIKQQKETKCGKVKDIAISTFPSSASSLEEIMMEAMFTSPQKSLIVIISQCILFTTPRWRPCSQKPLELICLMFRIQVPHGVIMYVFVCVAVLCLTL